MSKSDVFSDVKSDIDTKRVFKTINEIAHYLDQQRNRIRFSTDLFSNVLESQRARLCSYIEKLMFIAPVEYGRKCEEILWRKCFYDVYTLLKRFKKQESWTRDEISVLFNLLYSGVGFYHHLITRLQEDFQLNLEGIVDFPLYKCDYGLLSYANEKSSNGSEKISAEMKKTREWAENCVHRSLVYIGDLNRYMFDLYPGWDVSVAYRYYMRALYLKPEIGMPHNQLGTLSNSQNFTLDAVYRYLRCLYCKELFDGAEGNLVAVMEQYSPIGLEYNNLSQKKRIFSQFLHLIGVWFLQKSPIKDVDRLCMEFVDNINIWFSETEATSILKHDPVSLSALVETKQTKPFDLPESENTVFKILIVFIICHHKLMQKQYKGTSMVNTASTVIVAIISRAIEFVVSKLKEILPPPEPNSVSIKNEEIKHKENKRRRRRRVLRNISLSDDEVSDSSNICENFEDSDLDSEENLIFDEYSDDEHGKSSHTTNGYSTSDHKTNGLVNGNTKKHKKYTDVEILMKFFREQYHIMQVIKVSCDWLSCNKEVLTPISRWKTVFENFALLLNYSYPVINNSEVGILNKENVPLPEDVELKELHCLKIVHEKLTWNWKNITSLTIEQEVKCRLHHLKEFGKFLTTIENTTFIFDKEKHWFFKSTEEEPVETKENTTKLDEEQRRKLMKEMGQLWLEAEVKNLESKVKQTAKINLLTPYLVVDSEALTQYCILVKKLVSSRQFVLLIPTAVVSALDELKRTSSRARDAIRWLESQFRQGNRYLRMQRNNEKQSIPSVPYPRKKDNEAWLFMQIMECCYYLNNFSNDKTNAPTKKEDNRNFVRFLTGSRTLSNLMDVDVTIPKDKPSKQVPFNVAVVKKSTGLLIEHISDFYGKWKDSTKSHG
ncbi:hypothetical protein PGB90_007133 [Kerria lacca]